MLKKKVGRPATKLKFNLSLQQGLVTPQINLSHTRKFLDFDYALSLSTEQQNNRQLQSFDDVYPGINSDNRQRTRFLQDARSKRSALTINHA